MASGSATDRPTGRVILQAEARTNVRGTDGPRTYIQTADASRVSVLTRDEPVE